MLSKMLYGEPRLSKRKVGLEHVRPREDRRKGRVLEEG